MIVCHCHGISDRAIRRAVREGAVSSDEVTRSCSAGGTCGGCRPRIDVIVEHEQHARARSDSAQAPAFSRAR
jgi:bacterioferritin-associated ferredoxin